MELRDKLVHAVTEYDRRQSTRKGYNRYALAQYFMAIDSAIDEIEHGRDVRRALVGAFCGRLLDVCLKAAGLETSSKQEQMI